MSDYISQVVEQYKSFMKIDFFPTFTTEYYELEEGGTYSHIAKAEYSIPDNKHKLLLTRNICIPKWVLFHELTHMLDMERYRNGDYNHDFCLSGYMEYHAAQVELMKSVGAETVETPVSFSMKDKMDEMHEVIQQYVDNKLEMAQSLMESHDQKEKLDGIRALFNFFGLKSICSMHATDYVDNYTYQRASMCMSSFLFFNIRTFLTGWIENVDKAISLYSSVLEEVLD